MDSILQWLSPPPPPLPVSETTPPSLTPPLPPHPPLIAYLFVALVLVLCIAKMLWDCYLLNRDHFFPTADADTVSLKLQSWAWSLWRTLCWPFSALLSLLKRICDSAIRNSLSSGGGDGNGGLSYQHPPQHSFIFCDRQESLLLSSRLSPSTLSSSSSSSSLPPPITSSQSSTPSLELPTKKPNQRVTRATSNNKRQNISDSSDHHHNHHPHHRPSSHKSSHSSSSSSSLSTSSPAQLNRPSSPSFSSSSSSSASTTRTPTPTPVPTGNGIFSVDLLWCALLLLFVGLLFVPISRAAIRPSCRCVVFDDTYGKEYGIFTSPDWPVPYDDNTDCLLYTFQAPSDSIVEINFDEFDVQRNEEVGCDYGDYVKLFLHLNSSGITERTQWNLVLCGGFLDIEHTHYSSSSVLIFEFHSDWRPGNNTGFRGTFRFLRKSLFKTDGQLLPNTVCDYTFRHEPLLDTMLHRRIHSTESVQDLLMMNSRHYQQQQPFQQPPLTGGYSLPPAIERTLYSDELMMIMASDQPSSSASEERSAAGADHDYPGDGGDSGNGDNLPSASPRIQIGGTAQRGHFYSPQYPSTYPKTAKCEYRFLAQPNERVRLLFLDVSFSRQDQSCITSSDVIKVFDGADVDASPLMALLCGQATLLELLSTGEELVVQFRTKSHLAAKGFKAEFAFVPVVPPSSMPALHYPLYPYPGGSGGGSGGASGYPWWAVPTTSNALGNQTGGGSGTSSGSCDRWFSSDGGLNGTFTSPNYPHPYPANVRCTYHFVGHGKQRVQIIFTEFDVHRVENQQKDCEISDSVTGYVSSNGLTDRIESGFCGTELPPRIMSNSHRMTVEFKSLGHNDVSKVAASSSKAAASAHSKTTKHHQKQYHGPPSIFTARHQPKKAGSGGHVTEDRDSDGDGDKDLKNMESDEEEDEYEDEERGADGSPGKKFYHHKPKGGGGGGGGGGKNKQKNKRKKNKRPPSSPPGTSGGDGSGGGRTRRLAKGFRATYRFVTNFGVETGKQDSKSVCGFVYNSADSRNGTFTSPNFPGYYPKDTECHYFFYGNTSERIHIVFKEFDVEGVTPCTLETASDYVEFSSAAERKLVRYCGLKHPKTVESEGDFFRLTFKSNGRFDGTGFQATYTFVRVNNGKHKNNGRKTVSTNFSSSAIKTAVVSNTLQIATFICSSFFLLLLKKHINFCL